jgi:hypothetical protein
MVIVELPAPVIVVGLKLTVVPLGAPAADRLIALLKPPLTVVVIVEVPELPCTTLTEAGAAERVKLGAGVTVRVTVALCWIPPPFPFTVIGYVPSAVLDPTVMVIVELPAPVIVLGLKATVVPLGAPAADRLIALLKPPLTVVVTVDVRRFPWATLNETGEAESVKLPTATAGVRKATICMTHAPDEPRGAVALLLPAAVTMRSSARSVS